MKVQVAWRCAECGKANAVMLSTDEPREQDSLDRCESCGGATKAGALLQEAWNRAVLPSARAPTTNGSSSW